MVGKRRVGGKLVDNPDAKYAISESTRNMVRDTIASGLYQNSSVDQIAGDLRDSAAFSDARANLIAKTEVNAMNNKVALATYKKAGDLGVRLLKAWQINGDNPCDACLANSGEVIDLDDTFQAATMHPAHIRIAHAS